MNIDIKDKAQRFKRINNDEVFQEILQGVVDEQVSVFLDVSATIEEVEKSRNLIRGVEGIKRYIQAALDAEVVHDKKFN